MSRKSLLNILFSFVLLAVIGISVWSGQLILASRAVEASLNQPEVLGVNTEVPSNSISPGTNLLTTLTQDTESNSQSPDPSTSFVIKKYPIQNPGTKLPVINARYYVLYHPDSGKILLDKDSQKAVPIASTTKLMTALLADQNLQMDQQVKISSAAASQIGSLMGLYPNETITVQNLLYGLMLVSGNDSAYALAETVGEKLLNSSTATSAEKVARFVELMNQKADELSLFGFSYKDPAGLDDTGQGTAQDLAKLLAYINLHQPNIRSVATTAQITVSSLNKYYRHELKNSNRLVTDLAYPGIAAGKTGNTPDAGHCLTASAVNNDNLLVAVVLSTFSDDPDASALESRKLLDWGFNNYKFE